MYPTSFYSFIYFVASCHRFINDNLFNITVIGQKNRNTRGSEKR